MDSSFFARLNCLSQSLAIAGIAKTSRAKLLSEGNEALWSLHHSIASCIYLLYSGFFHHPPRPLGWLMGYVFLSDFYDRASLRF
ncbi:Non-canonical non-ribosomal peptide synthetase FUB8 [Fusarium oxysporum f. sp. albedinis]|nr:Non-canonical non-ribosomal peptide synthetase FUB8 [Fusarium oxysporum f. sp. albedinis]